jgi:uncharacterized protein (TIGR02246 family)
MSEKYREIVEKVNDAFTNNDNEAFLNFCADDVQWTIVGDQAVNGKDGIRDFMKSMEGMAPPTFTVKKIISDDDSAVAYGGMTMKDGEGNEGSYEYCDVYRFRGDKIAELRSFVVKVKEQAAEARA